MDTALHLYIFSWRVCCALQELILHILLHAGTRGVASSSAAAEGENRADDVGHVMSGISGRGVRLSKLLSKYVHGCVLIREACG